MSQSTQAIPGIKAVKVDGGFTYSVPGNSTSYGWKLAEGSPGILWTDAHYSVLEDCIRIDFDDVGIELGEDGNTHTRFHDENDLNTNGAVALEFGADILKAQEDADDNQQEYQTVELSDQLIPNQLDEIGTEVSFDVGSFLPDHMMEDGVTINMHGMPPGLVYNAARMRVEGTLSDDVATGQPYTISMVVYTAEGQIINSTFSWTVRDPKAIDQGSVSTTIAPTSGNKDDAAGAAILYSVAATARMNARSFSLAPRTSDDLAISRPGGGEIFSLAHSSAIAGSLSNGTLRGSSADDVLSGSESSVPAAGEGDAENENQNGLMPFTPAESGGVVEDEVSGNADFDAASGEKISSEEAAALLGLTSTSEENSAPFAGRPAGVTALEETPVTNIDLLAVAFDVDGDNLVVQSVSAENGTVVNHGDGTITYTPDDLFNGIDRITYTIADENGAVDSATFEVTVLAVNDAPDPGVVPDGNTNEDNSLNNIAVLPFASDVEGDALSVNSANATNGLVAINGDGTLNYTPNANFNGTDTITYVVRDSQGAETPATLLVVVAPINDAPQTTPVATQATNEDTAVTSIDVLSSASDAENDTISVTPGAFVTANGGNYTVNLDGTIDYTPAANFNGTDTINYTLTDGNGGSTNASFDVNVSAVNDKSVVDVSNLENEIRNGSFSTTTIADWPEWSETGTFDTSGDGFSAPAIDDDADGVVGTLTQSGLSGLQTGPGNAGAAVLRFDIGWNNDGGDGSTQELAVSIDGVVYATISTPDGNATTANVSFGNGATGTPAALTASNAFDWTYETVELHLPATVSDTGNLQLTWNNLAGVDAANDNISIDNFQIIRTADNLADTGATVVYENGYPAIDLVDSTSSLSDIDDTNLEGAVFRLTNPQSGDTFVVGGSALAIGGSTTIAGITYSVATVGLTTELTLSGTDSLANYSTALQGVKFESNSGTPSTVDRIIEIQTFDGDDYSDAATVTVDFSSTVTPPSASTDTGTIAEDSPISITVLINDTAGDNPIDPASILFDTPGGLAATYTVAGEGVWSHAGGAITFTPDSNFNGTASTVHYSVADTLGFRSALAPVNVTVTPVNDVPLLDLSNAVAGSGHAVAYTENDGPTSIVAADVLASDIEATRGETTGFSAITIDLDAAPDGDLEVLHLGSSQIALGTDVPAGTVALAGAALAYTYDATAGLLRITEQGAGAMTPAQVQSILLATQYEHTSEDPTAGARTFSITLDDEDGNPLNIHTSAAATSVITVAAVNDAPTDITYAPATVSENAVGGTNLTTLFGVDPDNPPAGLSFSIVGGPSPYFEINGSNELVVRAGADINFEVTPTIDVVVRLSDGTLFRNETITVTVNDLPEAPIANPPTGLSAVEDAATFTINALQNAVDPDGDPVTILAGSITATGGTAVLNGTTMIDFTPTPNFTGTAQVNYSIQDGTGFVVAASFDIAVTAVNDEPVIDLDSSTAGLNFSATYSEGSAPVKIADTDLSITDVEGPLNSIKIDLAASYDPGDEFLDINGIALDLTADSSINVAAGGVNFSINHTAANGEVIITRFGGGTFTTAEGAALFATIGYYNNDANPNLTDRVFTITATDAESLEQSVGAVSTISVTNTNNAPIAGTVGPLSTNEDVAINNIDLVGPASDPDLDSITIVNDLTLDATNGTVTHNGDGTITYTPNTDYVGADTITYTLSDGNGGTVSSSINVTVNAVNDKSVLDVSDLQNEVVNGSFATTTAGDWSGWTEVGTFYTGGDGFNAPAVNNSSAGSPTILTQTGLTGLQTGPGNAAAAVLKLDIGWNKGFTPIELDISVGGVVYATIVTSPIFGTNATVNFSNGATGTPSNLSNSSFGNWTYEPVEIHLPATVADTGDLQFVWTHPFSLLSYDDMSIDNVQVIRTADNIADTGAIIEYENGYPAVNLVDATAKLSDIDDTNLEGAVFRLTNPQAGDTFVVGGAALAIGGSTTIAGITYSAATVGLTTELTLSGTDTLANYLTALQGVQFESNTGTPSAVDRIIEVHTFDGDDYSDAATVTVDFSSTVAPPSVSGDSGTIAEDSPISITVLINDAVGDNPIDPGSILFDTPAGSAASYTVAGEGQWTHAGGAIIFTPESNFNGTASTVYYSVADTLGYRSTLAPIDVTVTPVNDVPVLDLSAAGAGTGHSVAYTENDGATSIVAADVLASDIEITRGETTGFSKINIDLDAAPDGDSELLHLGPTQIALGTDVPAGTVAIAGVALSFTYSAATGLLEITQQVGNMMSAAEVQAVLLATQYQHIAHDPTGGDRTFTITLEDEDGVPANIQTSGPVASVVTVLPVNDAPTVGAVGPLATNEDAAINNINLVLPASDPDGDSLSVVTGLTLDAINGTVTSNGNGTVNYVPDADFNGSDTISYTLSDGNGGTDTGSISVTVSAQNDAPALTVDAISAFTEDGGAIILSGGSNVSDIELDVLDDYNGASLVVARNGGGMAEDVFGFIDTPALTLVGTNAIDKAGAIIATFDTTATTGQLTITFTNANGQTPTSVDVDNILSQITYLNTNDTPPATVQIDWLFDDGNSGVQGSGGALTAIGSTTVNITATNDAPTVNRFSISTDGDTTTPAMNLLVNDSDPEGNAISVLSINGTTLTPGIAQSIAATDGTVNVSSAGVITFTPDNGFNGTATFDYVVTDSFGATSASAADIMVGAVVTVLENGSHQFTWADFSANASDLSVVITNTTLSPGGTLTLNGTPVANDDVISKADIDLGLLVFTPAADDFGNNYADIDYYVNLGTVNVLAGEPNDFTVSGPDFGPTNDRIADLGLFGPAGTFPAAINPIAVSTNIDAAYLAQGEVLFGGYVPDANYLATELTVIENWVSDGGVLITTNDSPTHDSLSNHFGMPIIGIGNSNWTIADTANPIVNGPFGSVGNIGGSLTAAGSIGYFSAANILPGDTIIAYDNGDLNRPTIVLREYGDGHILFTADEGLFRTNTSPGTAMVTSNDIFIGNVFAWAANSASSAGVTNLSVNVTSVNDAPAFSGSVDATPTFVENNSAVVLDPIVIVSDVELDALNGGAGDYHGASVTLGRNGTINTEDQFDFYDDNGISLVGATLQKSGAVVGSFDLTSTAGELTIVFTNANGQTPTSADVDNILSQITYLNTSDTPPASVQIDWTFDDGNVTSQGTGGALQETGSTTVSITAHNDAPTAGNLVDTVTEDGSVDFDTVAAANDVDGSIDPTTVAIVGASGPGTSHVVAGQGIWTVNAANGVITFTPEADFNGTVGNISYTLQDNGGKPSAPATISVSITAQNDAPTLDLSASGPGSGHTVAYTEGAPEASIVAADVLASDVEITNGETTGFSAIAITLDAAPDGNQEVLHLGSTQIALGTNVPAGVVTIAGVALSFNYVAATGVLSIVEQGGSVITPSEVQLILQATQYQHMSNTPTQGDRTFTITLADEDGTPVNILTSAPVNSVVTVTPTNDPVLLDLNGLGAGSDHAVTFVEDGGFVDIVDATATVVDPENQIASVVFQASANPHGVNDILQIGATNLVMNANASGTEGTVAYNYVATTQTLTLTRAGGPTNFTAAEANAAMKLVSYEADTQSPTAGTLDFNITVTDDGGATDTQTTTVTIQPQNDAPTIGSGALAAVTEDAINPSGNTISNLIGGTFTDPDGGASLSGIIVTANNAPTSQGDWQYSTDSGTSWFDIGSVGINGLALSASSLIRFSPAENYNGVPDTISIRGLDNSFTGDFTNGATRELADTSSTGGTSPISSSVGTISTSITAVDDVPVLELSSSSVAKSLTTWWYNNPTDTLNGENWDPVVISNVADQVTGVGLTTTNPSTSVTFTGADSADYASAVTANDYIEYGFTTSANGGTVTNLSYGSNAGTGDYKFSIAISDDNFASSTVLVSDHQYVSTPSFSTHTLSFSDVVLAANANYQFRVFFYDAQPGSGQPAGGGAFDDFTTIGFDSSESFGTSFLEDGVDQGAAAPVAGAPVELIDAGNSVVSDVEENITSLTISVSGVLNGNDELLEIAGQQFALAANSTVTAVPYGFSSFDIAYDASTEVFTITNNAGAGVPLNAIEWQSLITSIQYENATQASVEGVRSFTFQAIDASGGTSAPVNSLVNVVSHNDVPTFDLDSTLSGNDLSQVYLEGDPNLILVGANSLPFDEENSFQSITVTLDAIVDGAFEYFTVNGSDVQLISATASGTYSNGSGMVIAYSYLGATRELTLSNNDGPGNPLTATEVKEALEFVGYRNDSTDPTAGDRTFTIVLQDTGGAQSTPVQAVVAVVPDGSPDALFATPGIDTIDSNGASYVYASGDDDTVTGSNKVETLHGQDGSDTLIGGAGNDFLFGDRAVQVSDSVGAQQTINTTTTGNQSAPISVALNNGSMLVVWFDDDALSGSFAGQVKGQIVQPNGTTIGAEFTIGTTVVDTDDDFDLPPISVVKMNDGNVLVSWLPEGSLSVDSSATAVLGSVVDVSNSTASAQFVINTTTSGFQSPAVLTALSGGGALAVWTDDALSATDASPIRAQLLNEDGSKNGAEFTIGTTAVETEGAMILPNIDAALLSDGNVFVSWMADDGAAEDGDGSAVLGSVVDTTNATAGAEVTINSTTTGDQGGPMVTALSGGGMLIMWHDDALPSGSDALTIRGQFLNNDGTTNGTEFTIAGAQIEGDGSIEQKKMSVVELGDGNVMVGWGSDVSQNVDGGGGASLISVINTTAQTAGAVQTVNTTTAGDQSAPELVALHDGRVFATWNDQSDLDSNLSVIKGQFLNADGSKSGPELNIGTTAIEGHNNIDLSPLTATLTANGDIFVSWQGQSSQAADGDGTAVLSTLISTQTTSGADILTGGAGNDYIDGGAGSDTAIYSGNLADYLVMDDGGGSYTVTDQRSGSPDGTDTLVDVETLQFADQTVAIGTVAAASPIAFDLNQDGKIGVTGETTAQDKSGITDIGETVEFDIDGDGLSDTIEWLDGSGDALLIDNRDGNAANDMDGSRLFGDQNGTYEHGYQQLAELDANEDGVISGEETEGLELWQDDGDAVVQSGELFTLAEMGVSEIQLELEENAQDAEGRDLFRSTATLVDGTEILTEDVWFAQDDMSKDERYIHPEPTDPDQSLQDLPNG